MLEPITRQLSSLDPEVRSTECGRLILAAEALHFVQAWSSHEPIDNRATLFDAIAVLIRHSPDSGAQAEGVRLLAEVAQLPPDQQVLTISGSVTVPVTDIESATLTFFTSILELITAAQGEVLKFVIPRGHRRQVEAWLAGLPRR